MCLYMASRWRHKIITGKDNSACSQPTTTAISDSMRPWRDLEALVGAGESFISITSIIHHRIPMPSTKSGKPKSSIIVYWWNANTPCGRSGRWRQPGKGEKYREGGPPVKTPQEVGGQSHSRKSQRDTEGDKQETHPLLSPRGLPLLILWRLILILLFRA